MRSRLLVMSVLGLSFVPPAGQAQELFVAGVQPDRRPENAPVVTELGKDAEWYAGALHGVDQPYPSSLRFLESQGAWFTPFRFPGMTAPYDIRNWH